MSLPLITKQPANVTLTVAGSATFSVAATSDNGPLTYQWYTYSPGAGPPGTWFNFAALIGLTTASVTLNPGLGGPFCCKVTNASGSVQSAVCTLTYPGSPVIVESGGSSASGVSFGSLVSTLGKYGTDYLYDGDYSVALPCGLPTPSFPFLDQGDATTVSIRIPMEQAFGSYAPLSMTIPMAGTPGLYYFGDGNFADLGAGIWRFDRLCGNIPARRVRRGQSYTYPFQYILSSGVSISTGDTPGSIESYQGPTYSIGTLPMSVDSVLIYDYFVDGNEANFPLLEAPLAIEVGQAIDTRGVDFNGSPFPLMLYNGKMIAADGVTQILAKDDEYQDYRGAIKCRVRRLIAAPTLDFWQNNTGG